MKPCCTKNFMEKARCKLIEETLIPENQMYYTLPLVSDRCMLTLKILNRHSEHRFPRRYMIIKTRMISFQHELLTLGVILAEEPEELVYLTILQNELKVGCSVDTDQSYLSRYAYFALFNLLRYSGEYKFQDFYWPGFFNLKTGRSKYLLIKKSRDSLSVSPRDGYSGFYKPGEQLLTIRESIDEPKLITPITIETVPQGNDRGLGFCLSDTNNVRFNNNHYPFLVAHTGILTKDKAAIKSFVDTISDTDNLLDFPVSAEQQQLLKLCHRMRAIAKIENPEYSDEPDVVAKKNKQNKDHFSELFTLWRQALPLLAGRLYTYYRYTFGMRHIKGKPRKSDMISCRFSNEKPKLCFRWTDKREYFKLELQVILNGRPYPITRNYNTAFFITRFDNPRVYHLLNNMMEYELVRFFDDRQYQILFLKVHYDGYCKHFVQQLRKLYLFIK